MRLKSLRVFLWIWWLFLQFPTPITSNKQRIMTVAYHRVFFSSLVHWGKRVISSVNFGVVFPHYFTVLWYRGNVEFSPVEFNHRWSLSDSFEVLLRRWISLMHLSLVISCQLCVWTVSWEILRLERCKMQGRGDFTCIQQRTVVCKSRMTSFPRRMVAAQLVERQIRE